VDAQPKSNFLAICLICVIGAALLLGGINALKSRPIPDHRQAKQPDQSDPQQVPGKMNPPVKVSPQSSDTANGSNPLEKLLPKQVKYDGFVSSDACKKCHAAAHESWHATYHRTMTQIAKPNVVVGEFDDVRLEAKGRSYHLQRRGDQFLVTMADPDWEAGYQANGGDLNTLSNPPMVTLPIVMTTGSHHMQGYWVPAKTTNLLRMLPFIYSISEKRWLPREDVFLQPDGVREFNIWNETCITCHSVAGQPQINLSQLTVNSRVVELGIACESCHGPGEKHVRLMTLAETTELDPAMRADAKLINPAKIDSRVSAEICGQCHNVSGATHAESFLTTGYPYRAGGDLEKSHFTIDYAYAKKTKDIIGQLVFWDDGNCRVGGREYLGLIDSPCYKQGTLTCVSCHSMHDSSPDDQLAAEMDGNQACLQCHTDMVENISAHTHHAADSSGSNCYNCHMPHTSYALLRAIRSHRIDSPTTASITGSNRPNACNLCHLDQTMQWSADHLSEWYAQPAVKLDQNQATTAASLLWLLQGDAVQRTVVGWHMGWKTALEASGDDWQAPFLAELLDDDYAVTRFVAFDSLRKLKPWNTLAYDYVGPRSDRIATKEQVIRQWLAESDQRTGLTDPRLLIDQTNGKLLRDRITELLRDRNNTPIMLPE
jgi:predicted CXXCH cytochrome family protein